MNKEVKIASFILFNLSFGHVTPAFELVTRAENSVFKYYQTLQSRRKKRFLYVSRQFWSRCDWKIRTLS